MVHQVSSFGTAIFLNGLKQACHSTLCRCCQLGNKIILSGKTDVGDMCLLSAGSMKVQLNRVKRRVGRATGDRPSLSKAKAIRLLDSRQALANREISSPMSHLFSEQQWKGNDLFSFPPFRNKGESFTTTSSSPQLSSARKPSAHRMGATSSGMRHRSPLNLQFSSRVWKWVKSMYFSDIQTEAKESLVNHWPCHCSWAADKWI